MRRYVCVFILFGWENSFLLYYIIMHFIIIYFSKMCYYLFFYYRSANYYPATGVCELSEMDRITLAGSSSFQPFDGKIIIIIYLFNM